MDKKKTQNTQTKLFSASIALKPYLYGYSCTFYQSIYLILFFQQDSWLMKLISFYLLLVRKAGQNTQSQTQASGVIWNSFGYLR